MVSSVHGALDNRVFYREARTLARAGHRVTVIAVHDRDHVCDGIKILGVPRVARWRRPLLWRLLLQRASETGAHVFHFHDPELLLPIARLGRRSGRPTIYDVHEAYPEFFEVKDYLPALVRYPMAWAFRVLEPRLARRHSALVFADEATPASFLDVDLPKIVLPNYPDAELVDAGANALATVAQREPVVMYLGGLERNRGSRLMVDAFARVHRRRPDARLLHVGHFMPTSVEDEVRDHARRAGVEGAVEIVGRVPFEEVGGYLARAAVGWVTWQPCAKNRKNVPTKLFEYMAYGLPVVSSELETTSPFVEAGVTGHLVRADDPEAHAAAILALIEDPNEAARMGLRGRQRVLDEFNWPAVEGRLLDLYDQLAH
jgi:glycosyltransferase involved in cell wall biosynthesis